MLVVTGSFLENCSRNLKNLFVEVCSRNLKIFSASVQSEAMMPPLICKIQMR